MGGSFWRIPAHIKRKSLYGVGGQLVPLNLTNGVLLFYPQARSTGHLCLNLDMSSIVIPGRASAKAVITTQNASSDPAR